MALGAAVACAVLTGALLAGDSVHASLRELALDRLGRVDSALVTEGFFRTRLAGELAARPGAGKAAPLVLLRGAAVHAESRARASRVMLHGVDGRFAALFPDGEERLAPLFRQEPGRIFPPALLGEALARELGAAAGDDLLLSFERPSAISGETVLGEKDADDRLASRRFTVAAVIPDRGLGGFSLTPHQAAPRNAFVPIEELQRAADREGKANALLVTGSADLRDLPRLEDFSLRAVPGQGQVSLESHEYFLKPAVEKAVGELGLPGQRVSTYLATGIRARDRLVPYSLVSALSSPEGLTLAGGGPALLPGPGEVLLNSWAAEELGARPGDPVELSYLVLGPAGGLVTRKVTLRLAGVVAMTGLGADRSLTPEFPGIEDADDMAAWDPPFPVDLSLIRPADEEYWDRHRASPKAFVSEATGRKLWSTRFGDLTAVRFAAPPGEEAALAGRLRRELPGRIDAAAFGLALQPVRAQALRGAEGSTDFSGLLLAFSFFLIVSAVLLAGLLFSLAVERRAGELGLLLAVGYPVKAVRRRLLAEGLVLSGAGALLGLAGAVGYAWLLMLGLRTWWRPAVGTSYLSLHVNPASLAAGWAVSVLVVLLAVAWTVRRLARQPATALLAGALRREEGRRAGRLARGLAIVAAAAAAGLLATALLTGKTASPGLAFGTGAAALVAGLALFSIGFREPRGARQSVIGVRRGLLGMAARNGTANPGRSLLAVALVACACFLLVVVAANRGEAGEEGEAPPGSGGFELVAESDVPLLQDPASPEGRVELGLSAEAEAALRGVEVVSLRLVPGEDASCLNLFRPGRPRLLGATRDLARRGAFRFRRTLELDIAGGEDPWTLLDRDLGPGVIPAVADENSATWILHWQLGQDLEMEDEAGRPLKLRLVGLLEKGILQGEVLVAEENLLRHFPGRAGRSFFLLHTPPGRAAAVAETLEAGLGRFGFDARTSAERLAAYEAVESTYLSTFQTLGGLGLLLGTLGLGVALLRSVMDRRGELATLRAFGFRRRRLAWMVTAENALLLLAGVALGTLAGLLAAAPQLAAGGGGVPWASLAATLLAVLAAGFLSSAAAVRAALAAPLLPVLKEER